MITGETSSKYQYKHQTQKQFDCGRGTNVLFLREKTGGRIMKKLRCILICALAGSMIGCSSAAPAGSASSSQAVQPQSSVSEAAEDEDIRIETAYGTLHYPDLWEDYLIYETNEDNGECTVSFMTDFESSRITLFEIQINDSAEDAVGTITGPDGTVRNIHVIMHSLDDVTSDHTLDRLYAMQEDLNYLLDNLN